MLHNLMTNRFDGMGHFMAKVEIKPNGPEPDRRSNPPFNFIRWGFWYADDKVISGVPAGQWDVWPIFLDDKGVPIPDGVGCTGTLLAKMHIVFDESVPRHFKRLKLGTKFHLKEGHVIVANGTVTKLGI